MVFRIGRITTFTWGFFDRFKVNCGDYIRVLCKLAFRERVWKENNTVKSPSETVKLKSNWILQWVANVIIRANTRWVCFYFEMWSIVEFQLFHTICVRACFITVSNFIWNFVVFWPHSRQRRENSTKWRKIHHFQTCFRWYSTLCIIIDLISIFYQIGSCRLFPFEKKCVQMAKIASLKTNPDHVLNEVNKQKKKKRHKRFAVTIVF